MPEEELRGGVVQARGQTDALFARLAPQALLARSIPERHRLIFYLGHLEAFDWNLLGRRALGLPSFHPSFDRLFAFGIDPPPGQLPQEAASEWPGEEEVRRYVQNVRERLDQAPAGAVPTELLHVALGHRLMHFETLCYGIHQLPPEQKHGPVPTPEPAPSVPQRMVCIPSGPVTLGRQPGDGFGWDNEFSRHEVGTPAFAIQRYPVTNGDYLEFVKEGGPLPPFWMDGCRYLRTVFGQVPLPADWPVYVTWTQADAYARWRGWRLPEEAEWQKAAGLFAHRDSGNFGGRRFDPVPVTQQPGMTGNGWEWTATPFAPYPGFREFDFYPNYSLPFFDGEHYVLKGASPVTAAALTRPSFRNWFRRDYPYVYATFRCVEDR